MKRVKVEQRSVDGSSLQAGITLQAGRPVVLLVTGLTARSGDGTGVGDGTGADEGAATGDGTGAGTGGGGATGAGGPGLSNPRWGSATIQHSQEVELTVDAAGCDGQTVRFVVEHAGEGGAWTHLADATAVVSAGAAVGRVRLQHPAAAAGASGSAPAGPLNLRFHATLD